MKQDLTESMDISGAYFAWLWLSRISGRSFVVLKMSPELAP